MGSNVYEDCKQKASLLKEDFWYKFTKTDFGKNLSNMWDMIAKYPLFILKFVKKCYKLKLSLDKGKRIKREKRVTNIGKQKDENEKRGYKSQSQMKKSDL